MARPISTGVFSSRKHLEDFLILRFLQGQSTTALAKRAGVSRRTAFYILNQSSAVRVYRRLNFLGDI
jgi:hypothetical protein